MLLHNQLDPLRWRLGVPDPSWVRGGRGSVLNVSVCFCACKQMRPLQAAFPHCSSSCSYTALSGSAAPHSLEDGGLRSTVRWGTLVLCLQLPDRKLRQPGKTPASLDTRALGLCRLGCIFTCRRSWRMQYLGDARLSPGLWAAYPGRVRPGVLVCVRACECVWMSTMSWRLAFTCFWRKCHQPWAIRKFGGLKPKNLFLCRCWSRGAAGVLLLWEDYLVCRGALWKLLTHSCGKFNFSAGDVDTWCVSERMDIAWGLSWYYDIIIQMLGLLECFTTKSVQRKDLPGVCLLMHWLDFRLRFIFLTESKRMLNKVLVCGHCSRMNQCCVILFIHSTISCLPRYRELNWGSRGLCVVYLQDVGCASKLNKTHRWFVSFLQISQLIIRCCKKQWDEEETGFLVRW